MTTIVADEAALRALVAQEVQRAIQPVLDALAAHGGVPGAPGGDGLLTAAQVADLLQVDRRTLRRMVRAGAVPAPIILGEHTQRWRRRSIERWLRDLEARAEHRRSRLMAAPRRGSV